MAKQRAFTMIELLIVMAMMATLVAIVMPRYFQGIERTKETALKQNLKEMREAINHYYADKGQYPQTLDTLVADRYLRFLPEDPITESVDTWIVVEAAEAGAGVYDVQSGSELISDDGTPYNSW